MGVMRHALGSAGFQDVCADWVAMPSAPRRSKLATSFDEYMPEPFDDADVKTAMKALGQESDGRIIIKKAKGTHAQKMVTNPLSGKPEAADGKNIDKDAVW